MKPGGRVTVHELNYLVDEGHKRHSYVCGLYACLQVRFAYGNPEQFVLRVFIMGEHDTPG